MDDGVDSVELGRVDLVRIRIPANFTIAVANLVPNSPAKVHTDNAKRGPLLITAGEHDHTVPATISKQTKKLYNKSGAVTDLIEFEHRGHSLTIDSGWREVADRVLGWIQSQSL